MDERSRETGSDRRTSVAELCPGTSVEEVYLVTRKDLRSTKAGKPYLRLRVSDRTGTADCMVWEDAERVSSAF